MDKKIILVSHGSLASGMKESIEMIIGENNNLLCYEMKNDKHYLDLVEEIECMAKNNPQIQYIIVADILGGSVCNGCSSLITLQNVKVISGMNMKLVIELLFVPFQLEDEDIAEKIEICKESIVNISKSFLEKKNKCSKEEFFNK